MDAVWQWGLTVIVAVQRFRSPALDALMRAASFAGEEQFYLLALPLLAWSVEFGVAIRLTAALLLSFVANGALKDAFAHPRPYDLDPPVQLSVAAGSGLPSGHAQSAVVIWSGIAVWARRRWVWVCAVVLTGLISLSRVYLGVHFPTDVLGGWIVGGALLAAFLWLQPGLTRNAAALRPGIQALLAAAGPVGIALLYPTPDAISAMGALAGIGPGVVVQARTVGFATAGSLMRRLLRFAAGAPVALLIYVGLRALFPGEGETLYLPLRFVRYALLGVWISLGAPWLFVRMRLASRRV